MKCSVGLSFAFCTVFAIAASGVEGNLLLNADMSADDGLGFPQAWSFRYEKPGMVKGYSIKPNADGSFTLKFPKMLYLVQNPMTLIPGETYRMSAEVRTSKIGGNGMRLGAWDMSWNEEWWTEPFPADTKGEWKRVEWVGAVNSVRTNGFNFAVAGSMGDDPEARADIRDLRFEPVTEKAKKLSLPLGKGALRVFPARIVPIDPKIGQIPQGGCEMTFYWPGRMREGLEGCRLVATVDGKELAPAVFGERRRAKVNVGALSVGPHALKVRVEGPDGAMLAENEYPLRAIAQMPGGSGKKLNNLVTELVNRPLKDGDVQFSLPKDSWVWISFENAGRARGSLDKSCLPAIGRRRGDPVVETMRNLSAGKHVLHVTGADEGGRLRIHMVKRLVTTQYRMGRDPCSQNQFLFGYSLDFVKRFLVNSFNTVEAQRWADTTSMKAGWYAERGYRVESTANLGYLHPHRLDANACYESLAGTAGWRRGFDLEVDENGTGAPRPSHVNYAEAAWRMIGERPDQAVNTDWCDAPSQVFEQPDIETSEIAAIVNTGHGRGMLYPEAYSATCLNPQKAYDWELHFARYAKSAIDMVPAAKNSVLYYFAAYIDIGAWCDYPYPETDLKAHYAHFVRTIATNPEFDGTVGGLAFGAVPHGEEEIVRWMARVIHHYAIEGRTDDIAETYGFKYLPGLVKDPGFASGFADWKAKPAEVGGLVAKKITGYGTRVQGRKKVEKGTGDGVAVFTRSAKGPNELSQTITGLKPGKYYSLLYCTADYDDISARKGVKPVVAFNAELVGGEEVKGLRFRHCVDTKTVRQIVHRHVFKAAAGSHILIFRDWESAADRAGEVGGRRALNYVILRPYYIENESEVSELANFFQGR